MLYGVGATKELRDKAQELTAKLARRAHRAEPEPAGLQGARGHPGPALMPPRGTTSSAPCSSTAWQGSTGTTPRARRSRRCRTRSPSADWPSSASCTMTCARSPSTRPARRPAAGLPGRPPGRCPGPRQDHHRLLRMPARCGSSPTTPTCATRCSSPRTSVGYPANSEILRSLLSARQPAGAPARLPDLGGLCDGRPDDGSPAKLAAVRRQGRRGLARARARARMPRCLPSRKSRDPGIQRITAADMRYWREQYRRTKFNFDSQSVRPYFPYDAVERGVIATASTLFHVQIRPVAGVQHLASLGDHLRCLRRRRPSSDASTSTCTRARARTSGSPRSRSPRAIACTGSCPRRAGLQFPGRQCAGDPGLMQYGDVVMFLHEFGHLMHHVIGGQNRFAGAGGVLRRGRLRRGALADAGGVLPRLRRPHVVCAATTRPARCCPRTCTRA